MKLIEQKVSDNKGGFSWSFPASVAGSRRALAERVGQAYVDDLWRGFHGGMRASGAASNSARARADSTFFEVGLHTFG